MSKPPCTWCRNQGMTIKPCINSIEWVQVIRCSRCGRFQTDLEAANWHFNRPKVVKFDGAIAIVAKETDRAKR